MKIYYPKDHYNKQYRSHVFPLLKPFLKNKAFSNAERINLYGISNQDVSFVNTIKEAEIVVLTMSWGYYLMTNQVCLAYSLIQEAAKFNKKTLVVTVGDYGVKVPDDPNLFVLRTSGKRSEFNKNTQGIPVFIEDPLERIYQQKEIIPNYSKKPIIGFCGQSNSSLFNASIEISKVFLRNLKSHLKLSNQQPQTIQSTTFNRSKVLNKIKKAKNVEANFIERLKYRAGVISKTDREKTELDFYNNMLESNYVVCIRGAGNFSVRLYETLAMGRIPVFVNTDCLLPLSNDIEWKKHVVWVEFNELNSLEEKVLAFHNSMSSEAFKQLQKSNRLLWESKLTLKGFFKAYLNIYNL